VFLRCCCVSSQIGLLSLPANEQQSVVHKNERIGQPCHHIDDRAAGGIGTPCASCCRTIYPDLLLRRLEGAGRRGKTEKFMAADLADPAAVEPTARASTASCISAALLGRWPLGRHPQANIIGGYNCSRPRRKKGRQVAWCSPRRTMLSASIRVHHRIFHHVTARPDSRYGVNKCLGGEPSAALCTSNCLGVTVYASQFRLSAASTTAGSRSG